MLNQKGIVWMPIIIWSAIILLTGTVAVKEKLITINLSGNGPLIQKVDVTPTPSPNLDLNLIISSPDPTSTTIPTPKPVKPVYVDPDPIIDCESSAPNCKGFSIRVHQSQCSKITCCQVGDKWSVYPSSDQCTKDQNTTNKQTNTYTPPSNTTNKVAIYITSLKSTLYCNSQNIDVIKQLDSASIQENQKAYDLNGECLKGAYKSQPVCEANCNGQADYSACLKNCSAQSQQLASGCNSVDYYYQVNSLNKQIADFCNK